MPPRPRTGSGIGAAPRAATTRTAAGIALVLGAVLPVPAASQAPQECPYGRVGEVRVENISVFSPEEIGEASRLAWSYRLANRVHVRTVRPFIRREVLVEEGECFDPILMEESARMLRQLRFVAHASVLPEGVGEDDDPRPLPEPDAVTDVVIRTRDEWTTKPRIDVRTTGDGISLRGWELREENLLGRGRTVALSSGRRGGEREFGLLLADPQLLQSRWDGRIHVGRNRNGYFVDQAILHPFVGEIGRFAFRQSFHRRESEFFWPLGDAVDEAPEGVTHLSLPTGVELAEVAGAVRFGPRGNHTLLGAGLSRERLRMPGYPNRAAFSRGVEPDPDLVVPGSFTDVLAAQAGERAATRVNVLIGQRRIRYVRRVGLDALRGVQDVPMGTDVGLTLGRRVGPVGVAPGTSDDDMSVRFRLFAGLAPGSWVFQTHLQVEGRHLFAHEDEPIGWRDVLGDLEAKVYWLPPRHSDHTVMVALRGSGGWQVDLPFGTSLGGNSGLRGFREERVPAARRIVVSLEDRWALESPAPTLFDLGLTLFADVGRGWAGEVPFGVDSGWKAALGGGIRVGFPAGTGGVARLDVAAPMIAGLSLRDVVVTLSMTEVLGILARVGDPLLHRSRIGGGELTFPGVAH